MTKHFTAKLRRLLVVVSIVSVALIGLTSRWAFAACSPNIVELTATDPSGAANYYLLVQCGGTNYSARLIEFAGSGCGSQTIDTLKMWQSLAQTALMSGKQLTIYTSTKAGCASSNFITAMDLNQ